MPNRLREWSIGLIVTAVAVAIAYIWLDRPFAYFAHDTTAPYRVFVWMQRVPDFFPMAATLVLVGFGLRSLTGRSLYRCESVALLTALSYVAAASIKETLKYAFGRTWPETWINSNPSLIRDGLSGFNPFHGGPGYASFPSGHTAAITSVVVVLWICYPRGRPLYAALIAVVVVGLLGSNFHFLSDIIAGGFVGGSTAWIATRLWQGQRNSAPLNPGQ